MEGRKSKRGRARKRLHTGTKDREEMSMIPTLLQSLLLVTSLSKVEVFTLVGFMSLLVRHCLLSYPCMHTAKHQSDDRLQQLLASLVT